MTESGLPTGAVTTFLGQVRGENLGKRVLRLEYEGYEPLALKSFERISTEAKGRWPRYHARRTPPVGNARGR